MDEMEKLLTPIKNELDKVKDKKVRAYATIFVLTMLGDKLLESIYGEKCRKVIKDYVEKEIMSNGNRAK